MTWYRVLLHCGLPQGLTVDGEVMGGFYTTRFVEGTFDKAAGEQAIAELRAGRKFRVLRAQVQGDPVITVDEIEPLNSKPPRSRTGFVFYPADDGAGDAA